MDNPRVDTPRVDPMRRGERGEQRREDLGSGPALGRGFPPAVTNAPVAAPTPRVQQQQQQQQPAPVLVSPQPTQPPVLRSNPNADQPREDNRGGRFPRDRGNEGGGASPAPGGAASMPSRGSDAGRVWGGPQREVVAVGSAPQPRLERQPMGGPRVMNDARIEVRNEPRNVGLTAGSEANNARSPGIGSRNEDEWAKRRRGGGDNNNH
jgi:hypothetical protein